MDFDRMDYSEINLIPNKIKYNTSGIYFYDNSSLFRLSRLIPSIIKFEIPKEVTLIGRWLTGRTGELLIKFLEYNFEEFESFIQFVNEIGLNCIVYFSEKLNEFMESYVNSNTKSIPMHEYGELMREIYIDCKQTLIESQNSFNKLLSYCTNSENKDYLKELSFLQRYYMFINTKDNSQYSIDKYKPNAMYFEITKQLEPDEYIPFEDGFILYEVEDPNSFQNGFLDYYRDRTLSEEELADKIKNEDIFISEVFYSNILGLLYIEFHKLCILDSNYIKKCQNCGNFFIFENRADEIYCNRTINGKVCKSIGYYQKLRSDEFLSAYRTSYNTKNAQLNRRARGKSQKYKENLKKKFDTWVKEAKEELLKMQKGEIHLDDFKSKLNEPIEWGE